jgi:hypothetical protein
MEKFLVHMVTGAKAAKRFYLKHLLLLLQQAELEKLSRSLLTLGKVLAMDMHLH